MNGFRLFSLGGTRFGDAFESDDDRPDFDVADTDNYYHSPTAINTIRLVHNPIPGLIVVRYINMVSGCMRSCSLPVMITLLCLWNQGVFPTLQTD